MTSTNAIATRRNRVDNNLTVLMGNRIKQARRNAKVTQSEMADLLNMSGPNYSVKERGEGNFAPHDIINICKLLDITPDYVYCYDLEGNTDEDEQLIKAMKKLDHGEQAMLRARIVQTLRRNNISVPVKARRIFLVGEAASNF